jgi:hypothetical protein
MMPQQQLPQQQEPASTAHLSAASDDESDSDGARSVQELGDIASASRALLVSGDSKPAPMTSDLGMPPSPTIVVDTAADERPATPGVRPQPGGAQRQHADPEGVTWSEAGMEPAPMAEPVMVPADSWCRASIMQRRRIHERRTSDAAASDVEAANPSSATFRRAKSRAYGAGDSDAGESTSGSKLKGLLKTSSTMVAHTPKSSKSHAKFPSQGEGSANDGSTGGNGNGGSNSPGVSASDMLDEEKRLQLAVNESMNRMKALRAMSESVHKQISSLRSGANATPFVIDGATHQVLEVQTLEPKSLPPQRAEPRVGIPDQDAELEAERQQQLAAKAAAGSRQGGRAQTPAGGEKKPRGKRKEERPEAFWQPEPNANPMVAEVTPAAGVTHRDGESVRTAELKPPKSRVSRQEYAKLLSMQMTTQQQRAMDEEHENAKEKAAAAKDKDSAVPAKATEPRNSTTTTTSSAAEVERKAAAAEANAKKPGAGQPAAARVGTPKLVPRPSSENSGTMRRHPAGGVAPHSRGNSRVSTPAPGMTRKASERPSSTASHRQASIGSTIPAARVQSANVASMPRARAAGLPQMRLLDAEDDVARDFLSSLVASGGAAGALTDEDV